MDAQMLDSTCLNYTELILRTPVEYSQFNNVNYSFKKHMKIYRNYTYSGKIDLNHNKNLKDFHYFCEVANNYKIVESSIQSEQIIVNYCAKFLQI